MIRGRFRDAHPRIELDIPGPHGPITTEFILDTGFDGSLAIPSGMVRAMGVAPVDMTVRKFADGGIRECAWFDLDLEWNGAPRTIEVLVLEGDPLVGTELLIGCTLNVELFDGGEVYVEMPD